LQATQVSADCIDELAALRKDALIFIGPFNVEHKIAHAALFSIQGACKTVTNISKLLGAEKFGPSANALACDVAAFVDYFPTIQTDAQSAIGTLEASCTNLRDQAIAFKKAKPLVCISESTETGCEGELNKLKCDLLAFVNDVEKKYVTASTYITGIVAACTDIGNQSTEFKASHNLPCDTYNKKSQRSDYVKFANQLQKTDATGRKSLDPLSDLCEDLNTEIAVLTSKIVLA